MKKVEEICRAEGTPLQMRPKHEVDGFFEGMDLIAPGLVPSGRWRAGRMSRRLPVTQASPASPADNRWAHSPRTGGGACAGCQGRTADAIRRTASSRISGEVAVFSLT
jgi:hypothetical protein